MIMAILAAIAIAYVMISIIVVIWPILRWIWLPVIGLTFWLLNM